MAKLLTIWTYADLIMNWQFLFMLITLKIGNIFKKTGLLPLINQRLGSLSQLISCIALQIKL